MRRLVPLMNNGKLRAFHCDQQQARFHGECHQGRAWQRDGGTSLHGAVLEQGRAWQHDGKLGLCDAVREQDRAWPHGNGRELHGGFGDCDQNWSSGALHQGDRPRIRAFRVNKASQRMALMNNKTRDQKGRVERCNVEEMQCLHRWLRVLPR